MTDKEKLEAIRAEILRLVDVRGYDREMANDLLAFMDSLPNEPVSIDFEQELYKAFGQVKDFTLGMRIAKWFYDMGRKHQESVSEEEPIPKVLEDMFNAKSAAESLGISQEEHDKIVDECIYGKEPVSEDLLKELKGIVNIRECVAQGVPVIKIARHFANWQKQQDQSTIELAEDHAMLAGMEKMKEQMMKEMPKWKDNWLGHTKKPCIADEIPGHNGKQLCVAGKCISIDDLWTKLSKGD